ncbi:MULTISPECIES: glyoxalase superfamily protein [unclassified Dyella]|uniref:glyoxalase superfamily protein n=1 Tax=Dyella sp. ASV21 TaxID=2795114 RepID=UPI0018EC8451|nr:MULTISPECIES: glyoxalase superfamily protein [unclassified Dyella]
MSTKDSQKARVRRLQKHVRDVHGLNLTLSASYEALAVIEGFRDWNTYSAHLRAASGGGPLSEGVVTVADTRVARLPLIGTTQVGATKLAMMPVEDRITILTGDGVRVFPEPDRSEPRSSFDLRTSSSRRAGMSVLANVLDFDGATAPEHE